MGKNIEHSIRFGVFDNNGFKSTTWKLWTLSGAGKQDIYLACRNVGRIIKLSMHESGQWHLVYMQKSLELFDKEDIPLSKFPTEFSRPNQFSPGFTLACNIIIPWSSVNILMEKDKNDIVRISKPSEGENIIISIILADDSTKKLGFATNINHIGSIPIEGGGLVYAVSNVIASHGFVFPENYTRTFFKGASEEDLQDEGNRVLAWGFDGNGVITFFDAQG